uniref:Translation initiation factor eIF2B subunit delta n=2 Tax=Opuntia streptacantha TaxID=393608 RepID=A0A7C9DAV3_OPUST
MDPRRPQSQAGSSNDPKIRQVGFTFSLQNPQSLHPSSSAISGAGAGGVDGDFSSTPVASTCPVMIPPPRVPVQVPTACRPVAAGDSILAADSDNSGDAELSEEWVRSSSGMYSLGFSMSGINSPVATERNEEVELDFVDGTGAKMSDAPMPNKDMKAASKPLKEKTSKAERRAMQEAQRAAKAAKRAESSETGAHGGEKPAKLPKQPPKKKDAPLASSAGVSEKKGGDRSSEKDKKKDVPPPRMQYDDKSRVEKAKKRSVVKQTEARNRVELFQHLPQYEFGNQLQDLESKFFKLDPVHPAVYKVGVQYLAGNVTGSNARCIAMLHAFKEAIEDYHTPPDKTLIRDLTARLSSYISFLNECRPLSISMGNAIRSLKSCIAKLPLSISESEAKTILGSDIDRFINEKIVIANKVIVEHAATKVRDGDVLLTYGASSIVEMVLVHAYELGRQFRVVIVDSRPKFEGQAMLRRLVTKGLSCTYTHINAISYVMHEVTRVFLGAASVFSNGTVYSRVGTACVAMVAHAFRVPVLVCCEAYKFHERVQLDSICTNELDDPCAITRVPGRKEINYLNNWINKENLQLLNLLYDVTPADFISLIITDYGMVPPTSVPVIVREYRKEHLF